MIHRDKKAYTANEDGSVCTWTLRQCNYVVDNLRIIRVTLGLSMDALARNTGCHLNLVSRWELWDTRPDLVTCKKLEAALTAQGYTPPPDPDGVTVEEFMEILPKVRFTHEERKKLKINDQTIRNWGKGSVPSLEYALRIENLFRHP